MTTIIAFAHTCKIGGVVDLPADVRGAWMLSGAGHQSRQRLDTDALGTAVVTFKGQPAGSEIRVQYPDGSAAAGVESCAADQVLTWSAFAEGNPNNVVRIVIIDMALRIKEFNYETTGPGAQSIPIQPEADRWFLNP
jgi:hypothetical protein